MLKWEAIESLRGIVQTSRAEIDGQDRSIKHFDHDVATAFEEFNHYSGQELVWVCEAIALPSSKFEFSLRHSEADCQAE